jgi:hypothetical protein
LTGIAFALYNIGANYYQEFALDLALARVVPQEFTLDPPLARGCYPLVAVQHRTRIYKEKFAVW